MKRTSLIWAWGATVAAGAVAITACQAVAKLETREVDPLNAGCSLPASGAARIRIANLVPTKASTDFCIRVTGASDWGRPILRNGGTDPACQSGFAYKNVTAPFAVAAGSIDVKAVPAGGPCSQAATSEVDGVSVGDVSQAKPVVTIARIGGGSARVAESLIALPEDSAANTNELLVRVVHAIPGAGPLTFGTAELPDSVLAANVSLPVNLGSSIYPLPVQFGKLEPAGISPLGDKPIDAQGYVTFLIAGFALAIAPDSTDATKKANIAWYQQPGAFTETVYAVGDPGDATFPVVGLVCDDNTKDARNPLLESCFETKLPTLAAETFNVGLYGANSPNEAPRRDAIVSALGTDDADFLCVLETGEPSTHDRVVQALTTAGLTHIVDPKADLTTPPTDPTDWNGKTPPAQLANPPCGGDVPSDVFNAAYNCVVQNCNTKPGDETGQVQGSTSCISSKCTSQFLPLYNDVARFGQCFDCLLYNVATLTQFSVTKTNCTTDTRYPQGYGGANTSILASRFPFAKKGDGSDDVDVYFLPSSGFRRSLLAARVQPDPTNAAVTIDVYCGFVSSPLIISSLPYTGNYSNGSTYPDEKAGTNGWRDEQNFQIKRMIDHVKTRSGTNPAIVMGDWHASIQQPADSAAATHTIGDQSKEAMAQLEATFTPAHPAGYTFGCQYCPATNASGTANPYNGSFASGVQGYDFLTTYLSGTAFQASSTTDEQIKFTEDVVSYDPNDATKKGPLAEYYARRVRVLRPQ